VVQESPEDKTERQRSLQLMKGLTYEKFKKKALERFSSYLPESITEELAAELPE